MVILYLSRRNLQTLIAKLDAASRGEATACTIVKNDTAHPKYPSSHEQIFVTAVEDGDYYKDRVPGEVHPREEATLRAVSEILEVL